MSQDLNRYFQLEAEDLLGRITAALERMRQEPLTEETLRDLRRWAHTLKGAAQVVRREQIARTAHRLETALDAVAESGGSDPALDRALALTHEMVRGISLPAEPTAAASSSVGEAAPAPGDQPMESLRVQLQELDGLLQAIGESAIVAAGLRGIFDGIARVRDLAERFRRGRSGISAEQRLQDAEIVAEEIGDAVTNARRELEVLTENIERQLDGLRSRTENLRLVRADTIVPMIEQSVRAVASAGGKSVEFQTAGGDLELDAHVLIAARDALIQVARNAVAHGIESPAERVSSGKPAAGSVRLEFRREGSGHVFAIRDDGRGLDFEALRGQAVRRGWMTAEQAKEASAQELTRFLLRPGVTTARSAGLMAGRGVGLDLVSSLVARLKGELRISGDPGRGTTFEIRVPASMNSASVLMVHAGEMRFGIPLDTVRRTASVASLPRLADRYVLDGRPLPLAPLAAVFGQQSAAPAIAVEIVAHPHSFLLGVDGLDGIRQTIIHMLPDYIEAEPYVLGASIEAGGRLRMVLDPALLAPHLEDLARSTAGETDRSAPLPPILVIDDSLTTRMLEQSIFEMEGYAVDLASSAEEGLEMARKRHYGLFLVDVEMPGVDGFSFVERTRQEPGLREVPAILVTSRGSAEDRARGLQAGAREYVVKSEFDQRFLLNRVRELMRER